MQIRGNLIVSTRASSSGKQFALTICCVLMIVLGLVFLCLPWEEIFDNAVIGYIVSLIMVADGIVNLIMTSKNSKSYCEVYEYAVVGTTSLSWNTPNAPVQDFDIPYREIKNVTSSGKSILIYTNYATYNVTAAANCAQAVSAIRSRLQR